MQKPSRILLVTLLSALLISLFHVPCQAADSDSVIIVAPARFRVVKLLHDIHRLKKVSVVTCQGEGNDENPAMHALTGEGWSGVDVATYMNMVPGMNVVLIGDDATLPKIIVGASGQAKKVTRIETLDVGTIVASLRKIVKLSSRETRALAKRHGLALTDGNQDLRRWGRYGKPGTKKPPEPVTRGETANPVIDGETMPPRKIDGEKSGMPKEPKLKPVDDAFMKKLLLEKGDADEEPEEAPAKRPAEEATADELDELLPEDK